MQNFRSIGQGGKDVRWRELRILRHDLVGSQAIRQTSHDHSYRNARTSNARLSMMDIRSCAHSLLPCGTFHDGSLPHRLVWEGYSRGTGARLPPPLPFSRQERGTSVPSRQLPIHSGLPGRRIRVG